MSNQDKPDPKDFCFVNARTMGKASAIKQEALKSGTSYSTISVDDDGVHIKHHKASDVIESNRELYDAVYGKDFTSPRMSVESTKEGHLDPNSDVYRARLARATEFMKVGVGVKDR